MIYIFNSGGGVEAFTVTFMNGLDVWGVDHVKAGEGAICPKGNPSKPEDTDYTYSFEGWASTDGKEAGEPGILDNIQSDKTVYAAYSRTHKPVTVTFMNGGEVWDTVSVPYGSTASTSKGDPSKPEDDKFTYEFVGWASSDGQEAGESGILENVTSNKTVYAAYKAVSKKTYAFPDTISKSWEEIIADANAGRTSGYKLGDIKNMDLENSTEEAPYICFELAAMNVDEKTSGGTATFTWISKTIDSPIGLHPSSYALYPDLSSKFQSYFLSSIFSNLKEVKKDSYNVKVWTPRLYEMDDSWAGRKGTLKHYEFYSSNEARIRYSINKQPAGAWLADYQSNEDSDSYYGFIGATNIHYENGETCFECPSYSIPNNAVIGFCL